jgi:hypothetical protein
MSGGFPAAVGQGVTRQSRPTTPGATEARLTHLRINFVNSNNHRPLALPLALASDLVRRPSGIGAATCPAFAGLPQLGHTQAGS